MPLTEDFYLKRNDTREPIEVIAEEENDDGVLEVLPVAGDTIVKFHMVQAPTNLLDNTPMPSPGAVTVNATGYVIGGTPGGIGYQWIPADTILAGTYRAEFQLTFADGRILTFPNQSNITIHIYPDLA